MSLGAEFIVFKSKMFSGWGVDVLKAPGAGLCAFSGGARCCEMLCALQLQMCSPVHL